MKQMTAIDTARMNIIKAVMRIDNLERLQELAEQASAVKNTIHSISQQSPTVFSGIEHQKSVAGGNACIIRTRIPVWILVQARKSGASDTTILNAYPSLRIEDITNALKYYETHQQEINTIILENEVA